ncbi:MAG: hypothetical protein EBU33_04925 [Sphingobacteriia bacterium]|jgi:gliding motility-associated-like protein|nr:hypothetical protein [Sphingobacteriia bacterium]
MHRKRNLIYSCLLLSLLLRAQITPLFSVAVQQTFACTDRPLLLSVSSLSNNLSYTWSVSPMRYAQLSETTGTSVYFTPQKDLTYTISVSATDGATVTVVRKILSAYKSARASFNASLTAAGFPAILLLTNYSSYAKDVAWKFSDLSAADSTFSTQRTYTAAGSYSVTLFALGQKNCNDSSTYSFRISDSSSVVIPTVFTPNRDEINDLFRPITTGLLSLTASILSRDGILISTWNTINGSWDGRTVSGEVCPEGVYFVVVEATGFDAKTYKLKSNLTLLR